MRQCLRSETMCRFQVSVQLGLSLVLIATFSVSQQSPIHDGSDVVSVKAIAVIETIKFEGATSLGKEEKEAIAGSLSGETTHSDWLQRFQAKALRQFQNAGFLDASVTAKVESSREVDGVEHVAMSLAVMEGARYRIESVDWTGSSLVLPAELERLSGLHTGDTFDRTAIATAVAVLRGAFAERGFREAVVVPQFRKSPKTARVALTVDIIEGPKDAKFEPAICKQLSAQQVRQTPYIPSTNYDSKRDGQLDIARAEIEAERLQKNVLVFVGGQWCAPCVALERAFTGSPALTEIRDRKFVVVHINVGEENTNGCALRNLPNASAFPMVYVLNEKGTILASHNPVDWQTFEGFDPQHIKDFLNRW